MYVPRGYFIVTEQRTMFTSTLILITDNLYRSLVSMRKVYLYTASNLAGDNSLALWRMLGVLTRQQTHIQQLDRENITDEYLLQKPGQ